MILEIVEFPYNAISRAKDVLILSEEQVQNNLQGSTDQYYNVSVQTGPSSGIHLQ